MRILTVVLAFICSVAFAAEPEVRAVRHNQNVFVADVGALASDVLALVESCSTNSTRAAEYAVRRDTWERIMASGSFIHVAFPEPRTIFLRETDNQRDIKQPVSEILLPLPERAWPLHVLIKNAKGTFAFTNYDPKTLHKVLLAGDFDLLNAEPYKSLLKTPGK